MLNDTLSLFCVLNVVNMQIRILLNINVPLQWLVPQFGMASLCLSAHSLELFLRHNFLNLRRFYLVVLGLGAPLSSPT